MGGALPGCGVRNDRGAPDLRHGAVHRLIDRGVAHRAAERAARESYGKLLAYLAARSGDVHAAEDALADAFAQALARWPATGVPNAPEAWLFVTARHRLFDRARHDARSERVFERLADAARVVELEFERGDALADERLAMLFACAHPALSESVRGPLMLQVVLGLDAARIAAAFLVAPAAMSQRLVRAKRKIVATRIPLRVPEENERSQRLDAVLGAIYATFACAWNDPLGQDSRLHGMAEEAIRLGEIVAKTAATEPEALGLLALMLHAHARRSARRDASGAFVPLDEQDTRRWDARAIDRADAVLWTAARAKRIGRFQLEAAIQSVHANRRATGTTDWREIRALYDVLYALTRSPVVALNRAVAVGRVEGAGAGLRALDEVARDERLVTYQPYWAARADLLARSGDAPGARAAFDRASALTVDPALKAHLAKRSQDVQVP